MLILAAMSQSTVQAQQEAAEGQTLRILVNKSVVIRLDTPIVRVVSSNPNAIDIVATSPTQLVVSGKAPGTSSLIIYDTPDNSQILDVIVEPDISGLRTAIERTYPGEPIIAETEGGRIIISGQVSDPKIAEDVAKLAGLYSENIVNALSAQIPRDKQILLEVRFAEVDRTKISQAGINIFSTGAANTIGAISTQQFTPPRLGGNVGQGGGAGSPGGVQTTTFEFTDLLNIFLFRPDLNLGVTIRDLEQRALLQILAEPNLLALNGQKASFLAGGEFPFPVVQGGANVGAVTIQFRQFGVRLDFTGTIGDGDVIRMQVAPEVSTLDFANALSISGFVVPAFSTRRAETLIELRNGQSFGIAGLIDRRAQTQLSRMPGLADIPIIGKLFTSRSINRSNTELIVIVTPHIVDPVNAAPAPPAEPTYPMPFLDNPPFDEKVPGNEKVTPPAR